MTTLDESAAAIVEMLTRLDLRLSVMEAKVDAVLAVMARPQTAADTDEAPRLFFDRRRASAPFEGADRRMGEL